VLSGAGNSVTVSQLPPIGDGIAPVLVDGSLAISDVGSDILAGATVAIDYAVFEDDGLPVPNNDLLSFTPQNGITGSFNDGVLTLTGTASLAVYQAALDSVTYSSTNDSPTLNGGEPSRTIIWTVSNGVGTSAPVTSTINILPFPPVVTTGNSVTYAPGGPAIVIDDLAEISDNSGGIVNSATVSITDGFQPGDLLSFTNQDGITGSYNAATGALTLMGTPISSDFNYIDALRSITYSSSSANPTDSGLDATRTITWTVSASDLTSAPATTTINEIAPPVLAGAGNTVSYTQGGGALAIDGGLTVSDVSSGTLDDATVTISGGFVAGDELNFVNQNGIGGSYNPATGVLSLSGTASLANYTTALDSITFSSTAANPPTSTRTITWSATSDAQNSAPVTSTVDVTVLPPVLSNAGNTVGYTEAGTAAIVDGTLEITDQSSGTLTGATITDSGFFAGDQLNFVNQGGITGQSNGNTLALSGMASLAAYQAALDSVTFSSTSNNPTDFGLDPTRTIVWQVTSNLSVSTAVSSTVDVTGVDQSPTLSNAGNTVTFTLGGAAQPVDPGLLASDPDSLDMAEATVVIGNVVAGDTLAATNLDGGKITASYAAATGTLTLSGTDTIGAYQTALDSVVFSTTNTNTTARTVSWQINDGSLNSNIVNSTVQIANLAPVLAGGGNAVTYTEGGTAVVVDPALTVADQSSTTLTKATVSIAGFVAGDVLNATNLDGGLITESYSGGVLTLSGTATVAAYQAALDSVTFSSTAANPPASTRTITWIASNGAESSTAVTSTVDVTVLPPVLGNAGNTVTYSPAGAPVAVDGGLKVADSSSPTLSGATVTIGGFVAGDQLGFNNQNGITGGYNAATGVLTLSGTASLAAYQTVLDSITYSSTAANPTESGADPTRTITWVASSGAENSTPVTSTVDLTGPPVLSGAGNTVTFTGGFVAPVDNALKVSDASSTTLTGATVSIASGFQPGDELIFVNRLGITGTYNAATGVLTLSGTASVANYQAALDSIDFLSPLDNLSASSRQINWQVFDQISGGANEASNIVSSTMKTPAAQVISWINAKGGSFNVAGNWSPATIPGSGNEVILGSTVSGSGSSPSLPPKPTYTVTSSQNNTLGMLELTDPNATLDITNRSTLTLDTLYLGATPQPSANDGTITIGAGSQLNVTGTLDNENTIGSTAASSTPATIENGTIDNGGLVAATGGSTLLLQNVTIDNLFSTNLYPAGGEIQDAMSSIELDNATVVGGSLVTTERGGGFGGEEYTGLIDTAAGSQSNLLNGTAVNALVEVSNNSSLTLEGAINNSGEIAIDSTGQPAALKIDGNVSLTGGGFVVIGNEASTQIAPNSIVGAGAGATLTNVNDDIQGVGTIGNSQMTLVNEATILAASIFGEALTINTGSNPITNSGNLVSDSDLVVDSPVVGTGSVQINYFDTAEFGSSVSSGQTVDFDDSVHGVLKLDHAESFNGTVAGLSDTNNNVFDAIDMADFRFADTKITGVTGTGAKGTTTKVTVTDSVDHLTATLNLLNQFANQYAVNTHAYSLTADGAGSTAGTIFSVDHTLGMPNTGVG
jgi:hypothetical protein